MSDAERRDMRLPYAARRSEGENACVIGPNEEIVVEVTCGGFGEQMYLARKIAELLNADTSPCGAPKVELIPMILTCPACSERHVDQGKFATKPHHTHACQSCGLVWRPAKVATVGVQFLPGFKD